MEEELKQNTQQPKDGQSASPKHMSIRSILGGDILANDFFKRQTRLLILIMILTVLYIDNRYSSQQELIEIDKLKKDLIDIKYDALTRPPLPNGWKRAASHVLKNIFRRKTAPCKRLPTVLI